MTYITQVLLPKRGNDGRRYRRSHYHPFHTRRIRKYGGWTRKGQAEGAWLSPSGDFYADEHWIYEIGHPRRDLLFWQAELWERHSPEWRGSQRQSGDWRSRDG